MGRWDDEYEWDYYSQSTPRRVEGGIKAKSERGSIGQTWWSKRWVSALEALGMGNRLTRGRSYARMGQVLSIEQFLTHMLHQARAQARLRSLQEQRYRMAAVASP